MKKFKSTELKLLIVLLFQGIQVRRYLYSNRQVGFFLKGFYVRIYLVRIWKRESVIYSTT